MSDDPQLRNLLAEADQALREARTSRDPAKLKPCAEAFGRLAAWYALDGQAYKASVWYRLASEAAHEAKDEALSTSFETLALYYEGQP